MATDVIQAEYETLASIAQRFERQADDTNQLNQRVRNSFDALQSGGWIGRGAEAFFKEMEGDIFPALGRLALAMEDGRDATQQIVEVLRTAEEEAAGRFTVGESIMISPGIGANVDIGQDSTSYVDRAFNIYNLFEGARSFYQLYDTFDDPLNNLPAFLKHKAPLNVSRVSLLLGIAEAGYEGYTDFQSGEGLTEVGVTEFTEFGLETGIRIVAYSNPVGVGAMITWDAAVLIGDIYGVDIVSLDDVTDWMGNAVYDPGSAAEDVERFGGRLIDDIEVLLPPY